MASSPTRRAGSAKEVDHIHPWLSVQLKAIAGLQDAVQSAPRLLERLLQGVSLLASGKAVSIGVGLASLLGPQELGFALFVTLATGLVAMTVLKTGTALPRPYFISDMVQHTDPTTEKSFGFPSGHTMCTVVMWGVAAHVLGWDAALRVLPYATLLMAFSRVVTGAHFFHDVVGGAALGSALLWVFTTFGFDWVSPGYLLVVGSIGAGVVSTQTRADSTVDVTLCNEGADGAGTAAGVAMALWFGARAPLPAVPVVFRALAGLPSAVVAIQAMTRFEEKFVGRYRHHPLTAAQASHMLLLRGASVAVVLWLWPHVVVPFMWSVYSAT